MLVQCLVEHGSGGGVCHGWTVCTGMRKHKSMGSPWLPHWEMYPPAENLERPGAEKVPFHLRDSLVTKSLPSCAVPSQLGTRSGKLA